MKRIMRLFASVGLMTVLFPSIALAELVEEEYETELTPSSTVMEEVLEYKGARVGFTSERDIVFDIPPSMTCEDLTRVMNSFYSRYLEPVQNRPFTLAERRLFLLCIYTNLCDMSALWAGLSAVYDCRELIYVDCPRLDMLTGYLVDQDKLYLIRNRFEMGQYVKTEVYQRYVSRMNQVIYEGWTDDETSKHVPTEEDRVIFRLVLWMATENRVESLRFLEKSYKKEAIVWDRYWWIMKRESFRTTWLDLRRYYKGLLNRCEAQKATLERQSSQKFEDVATEDVAKTFAQEWGNLLEDGRVRLHRCVYDAPYCLLITKASSAVASTISNTEVNSLLAGAERWINRNDRSVQRAQEIALLVNKQMTDTEDITEELSTEINSAQTKRFLQLLKMAMGDESYAAFRESTKLIKNLEKVGDGYTL